MLTCAKHNKLVLKIVSKWCYLRQMIFGVFILSWNQWQISSSFYTIWPESWMLRKIWLGVEERQEEGVVLVSSRFLSNHHKYVLDPVLGFSKIIHFQFVLFSIVNLIH